MAWQSGFVEQCGNPPSSRQHHKWALTLQRIQHTYLTVHEKRIIVNSTALLPFSTRTLCTSITTHRRGRRSQEPEELRPALQFEQHLPASLARIALTGRARKKNQRP